MAIGYSPLIDYMNNHPEDEALSGYDVNNPTSWKEQDAASSSSTARNYLDILKEYSTKDDFWMEKYLDALERENDVRSARNYDQFIRSHYYQIMAEDLKKAGFNPYLALNSLGGSNGTTIMKNSSNYSASSARAAQQNANSKTIDSVVGSIGELVGAAAKMIPWILLMIAGAAV